MLSSTRSHSWLPPLHRNEHSMGRRAAGSRMRPVDGAEDMGLWHLASSAPGRPSRPMGLRGDPPPIA